MDEGHTTGRACNHNGRRQKESGSREGILEVECVGEVITQPGWDARSKRGPVCIWRRVPLGVEADEEAGGVGAWWVVGKWGAAESMAAAVQVPQL